MGQSINRRGGKTCVVVVNVIQKRMFIKTGGAKSVRMKVQNKQS